MVGSSSLSEPHPGFLITCMGGTGLAAAEYVRALYEADGRPFPMFLQQMDTDRLTSDAFDQSILIGLTDAKVNAIVSNPAVFGPIVETIVKHYAHLLNPEDVKDGSRTIRLLTQLSFIYHRTQILEKLRHALIELVHQGWVGSVIPIFISSSGGGAGSALQILLAQALAEPTFRNRLLEGQTPGLLSTPISCVVEPFALAMRNRNSQATMILANAMAFRMESAVLENCNAFKYVIHLGLANRAGVVLDSPDEIAKVLGTSVYLFQRNWPLLKGQIVNGVDTNRMLRHYAGHDVPEIVKRGVSPIELSARARVRKQGPHGNGRYTVTVAANSAGTP